MPVTGVVRISYPHLLEPKANQSGALKYSCCLLIPKSEKTLVQWFLDKIAAATAKGMETKWAGKAKPPKFRYAPLRDGDAELESGERTGKEYEGHYFINCSSNEPPGLLDRRGNTIFDKDVIYAGCKVRADINAFPFAANGNNGIGWGLNHVMFWEDGPRLDGRVAVNDAFKEFIQEPEQGDGDFDGHAPDPDDDTNDLM